MPMSNDFKERLFPQLHKIMEHFDPGGFDFLDLGSSRELWDQVTLSRGAHIYDEAGIRQAVSALKYMADQMPNGGRNFFAVKACPNIHILRLLYNCGCGFDCASQTEIMLALRAGATPQDIILTSNNTSKDLMALARKIGAWVNFDDRWLFEAEKMSLRTKDKICFRYNPGERRTEGTNSIIGNPPEQKYGLTYDQLMDAVGQMSRMVVGGNMKIGLHAMYVSNQRDAEIIAGTAKMLLELAAEAKRTSGVEFKFINIGGGFGIPYEPEDKPLNLSRVTSLISDMMSGFHSEYGYAPQLFTECGRIITGPNGVLVGRIINRMEKHKNFIGVDFCDGADLLRAGIYPAYHEVSIVDDQGDELPPKEKRWDIVGPLCENMKMVKDRCINPDGDYVVVHDTGAHGIAMGTNYNGWGKSQELLLCEDGRVIRIARPQTIGDLCSTHTLTEDLPHETLFL